ncbi:ABC transporter permease [Castellaniella sp. GW247-6E4]|uniref:ABC transporter permease n=1 Tax=Castellaniella sp. GW247-6E4 TaxID=3140380 RepID=UPI0033146AAC
MFSYVLRRLAGSLPVMGVLALLVFSLLYLAPGDPALIIGGDLATPKDIAAIRENLGLNEPFLSRFGLWVSGVAQGDLGRSIFTGLPVSELILQRLEPTIALLVMTTIVALAIAIPAGVIAAHRPGGWIDRLLMVLSVLGFSLPSFVLAYLLLLGFSVKNEWLPVYGYVSIREGVVPFLRHICLPSLALGLIYASLIARITRASMLEVLGQDYIRTARAKGVSTLRMLWSHALRNASVPIVTVVGTGLGLLISGAVVTETVFAIPGIGRLTVDAVLRRDYPIIQGVTLMFSAAYVLINLLIDISYTIIDPRIRY